MQHPSTSKALFLFLIAILVSGAAFALMMQPVRAQAGYSLPDPTVDFQLVDDNGQPIANAYVTVYRWPDPKISSDTGMIAYAITNQDGKAQMNMPGERDVAQLNFPDLSGLAVSHKISYHVIAQLWSSGAWSNSVGTSGFDKRYASPDRITAVEGITEPSTMLDRIYEIEGDPTIPVSATIASSSSPLSLPSLPIGNPFEKIMMNPLTAILSRQVMNPLQQPWPWPPPGPPVNICVPITSNEYMFDEMVAYGEFHTSGDGNTIVQFTLDHGSEVQVQLLQKFGLNGSWQKIPGFATVMQEKTDIEGSGSTVEYPPEAFRQFHPRIKMAFYKEIYSTLHCSATDLRTRHETVKPKFMKYGTGSTDLIFGATDQVKPWQDVANDRYGNSESHMPNTTIHNVKNNDSIDLPHGVNISAGLGISWSGSLATKTLFRKHIQISYQFTTNPGIEKYWLHDSNVLDKSTDGRIWYVTHQPEDSGKCERWKSLQADHQYLQAPRPFPKFGSTRSTYVDFFESYPPCNFCDRVKIKGVSTRLEYTPWVLSTGHKAPGSQYPVRPNYIKFSGEYDVVGQDIRIEPGRRNPSAQMALPLTLSIHGNELKFVSGKQEFDVSEPLQPMIPSSSEGFMSHIGATFESDTVLAAHTMTINETAQFGSQPSFRIWEKYEDYYDDGDLSDGICEFH